MVSFNGEEPETAKKQLERIAEFYNLAYKKKLIDSGKLNPFVLELRLFNDRTLNKGDEVPFGDSGIAEVLHIGGQVNDSRIRYVVKFDYYKKNPSEKD